MEDALNRRTRPSEWSPLPHHRRWTWEPTMDANDYEICKAEWPVRKPFVSSTLLQFLATGLNPERTRSVDHMQRRNPRCPKYGNRFSSVLLFIYRVYLQRSVCWHHTYCTFFAVFMRSPMMVRPCWTIQSRLSSSIRRVWKAFLTQCSLAKNSSSLAQLSIAE